MYRETWLIVQTAIEKEEKNYDCYLNKMLGHQIKIEKKYHLHCTAPHVIYCHCDNTTPSGLMVPERNIITVIIDSILEECYKYHLLNHNSFF